MIMASSRRYEENAIKKRPRRHVQFPRLSIFANAIIRSNTRRGHPNYEMQRADWRVHPVELIF